MCQAVHSPHPLLHQCRLSTPPHWPGLPAGRVSVPPGHKRCAGRCIPGAECCGAECPSPNPCSKAVCDDGIVCTDDACDPATGCTHTPNHDRCASSDPCRVGTCDPTVGCMQTPNCAAPKTCDGNGNCDFLSTTCSPPRTVRNPDTCQCECPANSCPPPKSALNPTTCQCECPAGTTECAGNTGTFCYPDDAEVCCINYGRGFPRAGCCGGACTASGACSPAGSRICGDSRNACCAPDESCFNVSGTGYCCPEEQACRPRGQYTGCCAAGSVCLCNGYCCPKEGIEREERRKLHRQWSLLPLERADLLRWPMPVPGELLTAIDRDPPAPRRASSPMVPQGSRGRGSQSAGTRSPLSLVIAPPG